MYKYYLASILLIISLVFIAGCEDAGGGPEIPGDLSGSPDLSKIASYDLSGATGILIVSGDTSRADAATEVNTLYKYTDSGELVKVDVSDEDGQIIEEEYSYEPAQVIDSGTKLLIAYAATDVPYDYSYSVPLEYAVFVDKSTGNAYMVDTTSLSGDVFLHYNANFTYHQVYENTAGDVYICLQYTNTTNNGFYKISFTETEAVMRLVFPFTYDCNSPTFLTDKYGNIAYEDSCKPWKIFTSEERMSSIAPDTFGCSSFLGSTHNLYSGKLRLNVNGMDTTVYTNTMGIEVSQSDLIITTDNNEVYVANNLGVIKFDENSGDLNTNVQYFYPTGWTGNPTDYNAFAVYGTNAYIATNTGIKSISLVDDTPENIVFDNNILDDTYTVNEMQVFADHILFTGKDPYLNNISAKYDLAAGTLTVLENFGKVEAAFNLIKIN